VKVLMRCLIALTVISGADAVEGKTLDEYIQDAEKHHKSGYLGKAVEVLEKAVEEFPESSDAHAHLGLYVGMQAGKTNDMKEAMQLVNRSFELLDKAVALDEQNPLARFHRGLMGVEVPEFFGKLDTAIDDLEFVTALYEKEPTEVSQEQFVTAYNLLSSAYEKRGDFDKARSGWERIIDLAPGSEIAKLAENKINKMAQKKAQQQEMRKKQPESADAQELQGKIKKEPQNFDLHIKLGLTHLKERDYEGAERALREAIRIAPDNVVGYKYLAVALTEKISVGYDHRIYEDTDFLTNLAFEVAQTLDQAVSLTPKDAELRLWRGIMGVQMPFFVQKLDQGIEDLNFVIQSEAPDSIRAEALYWLGAAYRKKSNTTWIEVVSKYGDSQAAQYVFNRMNPKLKRFDPGEHQPPFVAIEFVLGFQDELAPQTAVWIEDAEGNFVKTLYVSGFAGYVKERQINLPVWGNSSDFVDVDGVTGASIDVGDHIYVWNLEDHTGKRVKSGKYVAKVEVSHWPSMQYQLAEATLELGKKEHRSVIEEGNFIPYLGVAYYPK